MTQATHAMLCPICGGSFDAEDICKKCGASKPGSASLVGDVQAATTASHTANGTTTASGRSTGRTTAQGRTSGMSISGQSTVMGSTTVRRQKLGAGLVDMPPPVVASQDRFAMLHAVERDITVIEKKLMKRGVKCGNCNKPVTRIKGFCPSCTSPYDYSPLPIGTIIDEDPAHPGTGSRVNIGFLGLGAMGAVYGAWNFMLHPSAADIAMLVAVAEGTNDGTELHGRAEVVKVVLNATSKAQAAAAMAEMESATRIEHPGMARLYAFFTGRTAANKPVNAMGMEYVPGQMLAAIRESQPNEAPLPLDQAIAMALPLADFLVYLHGTIGYTLTDIKGDNAIYSPSGAKVVDAGGLHEIGKGGTFQVAPLYAAPEIRRTGPTPLTDVFAFFQTLAELAFKGFGKTTSAEHPLPSPDDDPIFGKSPLGIATYKTFARGLSLDPRGRFYADEASTQLLGLLQQVTADPKAPRPFSSQLFGSDVGEAMKSSFAEPDANTLPALRPDTADSGYAVIMGADNIPLDGKVAYFEQAAMAMPESVELPIAAVNTRIAVAGSDRLALREALRQVEIIATTREVAEREDFWQFLKDREAQGAKIKPEDRQFVASYDWREDWLRGRIALAMQDSVAALAAFTKVDDWIPGELAPKLAIAMASEMAGYAIADAARWYAHVWNTDPSYKTAAFGLARSLVRSQRPTIDVLRQAGDVLANLRASGDRLATHQLAAALFLAAVPSAASGRRPAMANAAAAHEVDSKGLLGVPIFQDNLRLAAEHEFDRCCAFATTRREVAEFLDAAGQARPVTLW